jgi:hypothetical protein
MVKSINEVSPKVRISYQSVQGWIKTFRLQCQLWITILQAETGIMEKPLQGEYRDVLHLIIILQEYFGTPENFYKSERKYCELVNKYRGSPFTFYTYR